jgi:hypothetical protein
MPSFVWGRDPQDAFEEPYEYGAQEQFAREAKGLLRQFYILLNSGRHRYSVEDASRRKAVWLLAMETLDSLRDCLTALVRKEHRVAGRLFRDATETMDLAAFFNSGDPKSERFLKRWYADEVVPHSVYRDFVKRTRGDPEAKQLAQYYRNLSRFTHRSYKAILYGYVRRADDSLGHDRSHLLWRQEDEEGLLVLPHTLSIYYAVLSGIVLEFAAALPRLDLISSGEISKAFSVSWEADSVPRRFLPTKWLAKRLMDQ